MYLNPSSQPEKEIWSLTAWYHVTWPIWWSVQPAKQWTDDLPTWKGKHTHRLCLLSGVIILLCWGCFSNLSCLSQRKQTLTVLIPESGFSSSYASNAAHAAMNPKVGFLFSAKLIIFGSQSKAPLLSDLFCFWLFIRFCDSFLFCFPLCVDTSSSNGGAICCQFWIFCIFSYFYVNKWCLTKCWLVWLIHGACWEISVFYGACRKIIVVLAEIMPNCRWYISREKLYLCLQRNNA